MAISGVAGWLNIRGVTPHLALPDEVYAGSDTMVAVRLLNEKRRIPSFLIRVKVLGGEAGFPIIDRQGTEAAFLIVRFRGRGHRRIERLEISSPFPINFFVRRKSMEIYEEVLVIPQPRPCRSGAHADGKGEGGELAAGRKGYEGDISRIVDYTGGEPLKMIHWRLSARHGELKVKEMTAAVLEPVIIDIDALPGAGLEERLSCGVYLVNRMIRENRPAGLRLKEKVVKPALSNAHRLRLLAELATYGQD